MKTIKTWTNTLPLVSINTYYGAFDTNSLIDSYTIDEDFKEGYVPYNAEMYWDGFDMDLYKNDIVQIAKNYILHNIFPEIKKLNLGIKKIEIFDMYSPKEYNFESDHINFDLIVNNNFYKNLLKIIKNLSNEDKNNLDSYLRKKFSSRDGFMSFTANNLGDLMSEIKREESRETSVFLYWYFLNKGSEDLKEYLDYDNWVTYFYENREQYTEFVTDEFIKQCEMNVGEVVSYVYDNYMTKDAETIIIELTDKIENETNRFDNNELRIERMIKTVNNVFKTIEDKTLNLFGK